MVCSDTDVRLLLMLHCWTSVTVDEAFEPRGVNSSSSSSIVSGQRIQKFAARGIRIKSLRHKDTSFSKMLSTRSREGM